MSYQLHNDQDGNLVCIRKIGTNVSIPLAPDNTDYQEYLAWLAEGNTPAPYVAPPPPTPLTTEQKIARAGFNEGELEDFLVEKIRRRLIE